MYHHGLAHHRAAGHGVVAALIYPTTLAIITDTFRDPKQRAVAIGLWVRSPASASRSDRSSAVRCWRSSGVAACFALVPIALVAAGGLLVIPPSSVDRGTRLDRGGLLLSVVMLRVAGLHDHRSAGTRLDLADNPWPGSG